MRKKKEAQKKGAIELSMTTVIVIILGVTLLSLGLFFIRGIFTKTTGLTEGAFEEAEASIGKLGNIESELTLTSKSVNLKQGQSKGIGIVMANLGDKEARFKVQTSLPPKTAQTAKFTCNVQETESTSSDEVPIKSGEKKPLHILIIDQAKSNLGTYVCKVSLFKDGKLDLDDSVIINVVA